MMNLPNSIALLVCCSLITACRSAPSQKNLALYREYARNAYYQDRMVANSERISKVAKRRPADKIRRAKHLSASDVREILEKQAILHGPHVTNQVIVVESMRRNISRGDRADWVEYVFGVPHFTGRIGDRDVWIYQTHFPYEVYIFFNEKQAVDWLQIDFTDT